MTKRFLITVTAMTLLIISSIAFAEKPIKLFFNGREIQSDVLTQIVNGRIYWGLLAEQLKRKS